MKRLFNSPVRLLCLMISVLVFFEAVSLIAAYRAATLYLLQHDPRAGGSATEAVVLARPRLLRRGEQIAPDSVIEHLRRIGYQPREGADAGTYHFGGNRLRINARLPEFQRATISFKGHRIEAITIEGRQVERLEIEPSSLVSFIRCVRGDVAARMRARKIVLQSADLIPSALYDAVRASEDHRFASHNGIDELGLIKGLLAGRGGSTITQQMIKNVVLADQSRTVGRKAQEMMLALAAERMYTKEEIFAAYANNCYLGHVEGGPTIFGFAAAAQELFGKADVKSLTLSESGALAGLLNQPEAYLKAARNGDYQVAIARRDRVLDLMRDKFSDRYSAEVIEQAKREPLMFLFASERDEDRPLDMISKPFQMYAAERAGQVLGDGGEASLRIYTTMDEDLQRGAAAAVERHLSKFDPKIKGIRQRLGLDDGGRLEAALVAMDARSGEILAMIGGRDGQFNRALARRSPASAIKPFVYLKAIEDGWHDGPFTAATVIDPRSDPVDNYRPTRHVGVSRRARQHLAASDNGAAVVAARDAGLVEVRDFIRRLTGSYSEELTGMLAIGGSRGCEVSPLDLASAYTVFPNGGMKVSAIPFAAVYRDGVRVEVARRAQERMIGSEAAYVVTEMMRSVTGHGPDGGLGTARGVKVLAGLAGDYEIAGKTGTGEVSDFWFVGLTPRLIVAVWAGMDDNMPLGLEEGFDAARVVMPVWAEFMRAVKTHRPDLLEGRFVMPSGVRVLRIDPVKGCVTKTGGIEEYFIAGREPRNCEP